MSAAALKIKDVSLKINSMVRYGRFNFIAKIFRYLMLIGFSYLILFPIFKMMSTALTYWEDIASGTTVYIPKTVTFDNFIEAINRFDYWKSLAYTAKLTIFSTIFQLFSTSFAGYGLARFRFKGQGLLFACVIITIILPVQTAQIPMFLNYRYFDFFGIGSLIGIFTGKTVSINLLNSIWVYIIPALFGVGISSGLYIFLFRQMFKGMPIAIDEAAMIDGCGPFGILFRVIFPNAIPVYITVTLLSFINYWNDVVIGTMFNSQAKIQPLMVRLKATMITGFFANGLYEAQSFVTKNAILFLIVFPLLLLFIICQKSFVDNMDRSGVKG